MLEYEDTNFQKTVLKDAIDLEEKFTFEKTNFNVAVGIFDENSNLAAIDEKFMSWSAHMQIKDRVIPDEDTIY